MNLLDTDVLSHLQKNDPVGTTIVARMAAADPDFRITIINAYEMLGGAVHLIHELRRKQKDLIPGFQLLQELLEYSRGWRGRILPYNAAADQVYVGFPPRLRQDLGFDARIAAIALTHGAVIWTCNVDDYKRVPGLAVFGAEAGTRVS